MKTKTLDDIQRDMSELYESTKTQKTELKMAAELSNITGKYLKAEQLKLAREIFLSGRGRVIRNRRAAKALTESA